MAMSLAQPAADAQGEPVDHRSPDGSTRVDLLLTLIRQAMDRTGWTQEALALEMAKDKGYVSKVLSGEKPLGGTFLRSLPHDLEAVFAGLYAETFGLIVVSPVSGDLAVRNFVSGLLGVLTPTLLPAKADRMAHAALRPTTAKRRTA